MIMAEPRLADAIATRHSVTADDVTRWMGQVQPTLPVMATSETEAAVCIGVLADNGIRETSGPNDPLSAVYPPGVAVATMLRRLFRIHPQWTLADAVEHLERANATPSDVVELLGSRCMPHGLALLKHSSESIRQEVQEIERLHG